VIRLASGVQGETTEQPPQEITVHPQLRKAVQREQPHVSAVHPQLKITVQRVHPHV
jgi:hypothetical protein